MTSDLTCVADAQDSDTFLLDNQQERVECVCVCVCVCVDDQQSFIAISQQVNTRAWFRLNLHTHNQPVW